MGALSMKPGQFFFEELGSLGSGGLGRVDKIRITATNARTLPVGSVWARKQLNEEWAANPSMIVRLDREIAALKQMSHPNIVTCEGENLPGGGRFYVMPLFESTLRRHIAEGGWKGKWKEIANAGAALAEAMQYAHDRGYVHRDLKPDNILFNSGGSLIIADWGIGYFVHKESKVLMKLTRGGMGTEYYCSLEQWATGKADARGDIYALGMTLDEWLTGEQRTITVGMGVPYGAVASSSAGAIRFNLLLQAMTQPFPAGRPNSMSNVAAELRAIAAAV